MALRLPSPPAAVDGSLAARLALRADALLRDHDLAGWVALFRSTDVASDVHRRYEARRTLGERALAHAGGSPAQIAERMLVVAGRLLHVLDEEPREPVLLNHAGVAFYELGDLDAAEGLFDAARRLDPALAQVDGNLAEVRRRRGGVAHQQGLPADVREGLRVLGPRVHDVVGRARPAEGLTVALCMIVKDEEAMLGRSLAAVAPWVDDLIVVDTGSTDRTVEIARSHGARVLHHEWQNDFAAARNVSLDAATTDWVLVLDADEVLVEGDGPRLRELLGHTWREAHFLVETNYTGTLESRTATTHDAMRLVRHRPERRFAGRVHEQIQHVPAYLPERFAVSTVRVDHFGYLGEVRERKDKMERNRALLAQQVADGEDSPFLHFNLGMEHVAAGDVMAALQHLELSWERLSDDPDRGTYGYVPMLASHLVAALHQAERHDDALIRAAEGLALFPGFTDIVLVQGHVHRAAGDPVAAEERYRHALALGDAPSAYVGRVGAGTHLAGGALAALLVEQDRTDEAEGELRAVLRAQPESDAARLALAEALVRQNRLEDAATEAPLVAAGGPHEEAALRHAAFCLLATDRPADDVLERAAAVLPADDHALFAAWAGHDRTLSSAAAELALTLLNALARLERFDAFERLVAVYERTGLPWRERRERLARLYLRRGFLRSAAEEWMAVVDRAGPDVDALRGLAIVATEMGLDDDAVVFAADADALEDGSALTGAAANGDR